MIGKISKGRGSRGLMSYLLADKDHSGGTRPRADIVGGTLSGRNEREIAREFGMLRQLRPSLGLHVMHVSLSKSPTDRALTDREWSDIGSFYAQQMGFEHFTIVSHGDHIHLAASRIKSDGTVVADQHNYRRSEVAVRAIEERWGLAPVASSHLLERDKAQHHRKAPAMPEIAMAERGRLPVTESLRDLLDAVLLDKPTVTQFIERMEQAGISVLPNLAQTGKLNGFAYRVDGRPITAKALGRKYTFSNLLKNGLSYEPDRDNATCRTAIERATNRAISQDPAGTGFDGIETGRSGPTQSGPGNQFGAVLDATSESHGSAQRRDAPNSGPGRAPGQGSSSSTRQSGEGEQSSNPPARDNGKELNKIGRGSSRREAPQSMDSSPSSLHSSVAGGVMASLEGGLSMSAGVVSDDDAVIIDGNDTEAVYRYFRRLSAFMKKKLAERIADDQRLRIKPSRPFATPIEIQNLFTIGTRKPHQDDQSTLRVLAQLAAFEAAGVSDYEVQPLVPRGIEGLRNERIRKVSAAQLSNPKFIGWLKRMNLLGYDIQIRPGTAAMDDESCHGLVFADDMDRATAQRMIADGFPFVVLLESSPGRYHGWIRISDQPMHRRMVTKAGQILAERYGLDKNSSDWKHYGRLSGYTNQKPSRRLPNGKAPFVELRSSAGPLIGGGAMALKAEVEAIFASVQYHAGRDRRAAAFSSIPAEGRRMLKGAANEFARGLELHKGGDSSASAADFSAALRMARIGFSEEEIAAAIVEASPALATRHRNVEYYASRTAEKALQEVAATADHLELSWFQGRYLRP